ncbi:hypothetical protein J7E73_20310 [Paenibacillus albidus]|uniref:hypothetical protein n=1 Tax=Paenibacillus albidus TaxID=2041023 RepID=UPI001BE5BB97|nr:hypothetical protein [Paenibacillus albidus]MBT2291423.1 hypothetical protein [Paenibacillus albidus]
MKKLVLLVMSMVLLFPISAFAASRDLLNYVAVYVEREDLYVGETVEMAVDPKGSETYDSIPAIVVKSSDESVLKVSGDLTSLEVTGVSEGVADVIVSSTSDYDELRFTFYVTEDTQLPQQLLDLQQYFDDLTYAAELEEKATVEYNKHNIVDSSNRKQAYISFNTIIVPSYTKFRIELKKVTPANPELVKIHKLSLEGTRLQLEGFTMMQKVLYNPNVKFGMFSAANKKIAAGEKYLDAFTKSLDQYQDKYSNY